MNKFRKISSKITTTWPKTVKLYLFAHTTLAWSFKLKVHRNVVGDSACFLPAAFVSEGEGEKARVREKNHTFAELNGKRATTTAITIFTVMMSDRSRWSANIKLIHLIFFLSPPSPFYLAHIYIHSFLFVRHSVGNVNQFIEPRCCKGINESFVFTYKNYTRAAHTHTSEGDTRNDQIELCLLRSPPSSCLLESIAYMAANINPSISGPMCACLTHTPRLCEIFESFNWNSIS